MADDGSTDGTYELLKDMQLSYSIHVLRGKGDWFYSGGMHVGMEYALQHLPHDFDYMLMMNDDVVFLENTIEQMISQSIQENGLVIVGTTCNEDGELSYGAIKYIKSIRNRVLDSPYKF